MLCTVNKQLAASGSTWIGVEIEVGTSIRLHRQHLAPQHWSALALALHIQAHCFRVDCEYGQRWHLSFVGGMVRCLHDRLLDLGRGNNGDNVARYGLCMLRRANDENVGESSVGQLLRHMMHIDGGHDGGDGGFGIVFWGWWEGRRRGSNFKWRARNGG